MKKSIVGLVLSLAVGLGLAWSHEGRHDSEHGSGGKEVTVKGELVDMACYMAHEGRGKKHGECGKMCVKNGAPLGLVTPDGKVYLLIEDHSTSKASKPYAQAKEMVAQTAIIKGDMYERGGVRALAVESVTKE